MWKRPSQLSIHARRLQESQSSACPSHPKCSWEFPRNVPTFQRSDLCVSCHIAWTRLHSLFLLWLPYRLSAPPDHRHRPPSYTTRTEMKTNLQYWSRFSENLKVAEEHYKTETKSLNLEDRECEPSLFLAASLSPHFRNQSTSPSRLCPLY